MTDNSTTTNHNTFNIVPPPGASVEDIAEAVVEILDGNSLRNTGSSFGAIERRWLQLE